MKSLLNTLLLTLAMGLTVEAQITLTSANAPVARTGHRTREADSTAAKTLNIGLAGASRTWDFRTLVLDPNEPAVLTTFALKTGAPQAASFPTATLISRNGLTTDSVTYHRINSAEWVTLGDANATQANVSSQPTINFSYPFTFNSTFRDTIVIEEPDLGVSVNLIGTTTGDAWGTIQTSLGSFNALRVKRAFAGSLTFQGIPIDVNLLVHEWWTNQYTAPVLSHQRVIVKVELLGVLDTTFSGTLLTAQTVGNVEIAENRIKNAYPSPASDITTLDLDLPTAGNTTALIIGMNGMTMVTKSLGNLPVGKQQVQLNVSNLANGMYQVIIVNEQGNIGKQKIVVSH